MEKTIDQFGQWVYNKNKGTDWSGRSIGDELLADRLDKMDPDKKVRLINAAMKEFGENRFEKASTNAIVKAAGISKGLLYHYFRSKEELYEYLFDYAMKAVAVPIAQEVGLEETDIIRRIERITKLKVEIFHELPSLVSFTKAMYAGMDYEDVKKVIEKYNPISVDMYYTHNVDKSLFKDDVDVEMAVKIIQYTLEKVGERYMMQRNMGFEPDMESIINEVKAFLSHFRQMYYKKTNT